MPEIAVIRTSDRASFKRCRRRWAFSSHLQHNRTSTESAEYFWLGSGGHYALEDFHGYNYYKSPVEAFRAYVYAQRSYAAKYPKKLILPQSIDEQTTLGEGLMEYYLMWLQNRDPLKTLWVDGVPQCEVVCTAELPIATEHYDKVIYQATLDRVVVIDGDLWILDYKFYNKDWNPNLDFDMQMSAYIWLAQVIYEKPVKGAILEKHFKRLPEAPKILSSGKISSNKSQHTSYHLYREALQQLYGEIDKAPLANRQMLEELMEQEGVDRDNYIQRARTTRTNEQIGATGQQILYEVADMINPELPLYKNETKDCSWDCSFSDICLMMDQGMDWEDVLYDVTVDRKQEDEGWRAHLPHQQVA